jgi:probable rRNA maturation factor
MAAAPRLKCAIRVVDPVWRRQIPALARFARGFAERAHAAGRADGAEPLRGDVTIAFAGDDAIRALNATFRGKEKPTNVLSFPDRNGGGDIMLALETVAAEAAAQGKPLVAHAAHLIVHGILHLMGYDHATQGEARRMERLERSILARSDIADPYVLGRIKPKP